MVPPITTVDFHWPITLSHASRYARITCRDRMLTQGTAQSANTIHDQSEASCRCWPLCSSGEAGNAWDALYTGAITCQHCPTTAPPPHTAGDGVNSQGASGDNPLEF